MDFAGGHSPPYGTSHVERFTPVWNNRVFVAAVVDEFRQRGGGFRFAVDEEHLAGSAVGDEVLEPPFEILGVGVSRQAIEHFDACIQRQVLVEDVQLFLPLDDPSAERILSLPADDDDGVTLVGHAVSQVMADAAVLAHAAGGNDDEWAFHAVQRRALFDRFDDVQLGEVEQIVVAVENPLRFVVHDVGVLPIDFRQPRGERAVEKHGNPWQMAALPQVVQEEQNLLSASETERGNDHLPGKRRPRRE